MISKAGKTNHSTGPTGRSRRRNGRQGARRRFSKSELAVFKQLLLDKRRALVNDVEMICQENRADGPIGTADQFNPGDLVDICSSTATLESEAQLMERGVRLLEEIDDALQRIEQGTYGLCLATGKPISKARLMAIPWAKYCKEYARELEGKGSLYEK